MNLPNKLTLSRIVMIPVFVLFFYLSALPYHTLCAAAVFAIAAFTDFLDGYIARKYNLVTNMGKFLDPIADKVLVSTAFILLLTEPALFTAVSAPMLIAAGIAVALILARELIIGGFRLVAVEKRAVIAADKLGKFKTVTQDFTVLYFLIAMAFLGHGADFALGVVGISLLGVTTLLTVASGANYIIRNRSVLSDRDTGTEQA